jgi:beta-lactamase superfamily II metal-dependent hydrolase
VARSAWAALLLVALLAGGCRELSITSVSPDLLSAGQASELEVRGTGFVEGLSLRLEGPGLEVTLAPVTVSGDGTARARVPGAAPPGQYALVASVEGLSARLDDAVRISGASLRVVFIDVGQGDGTLVIAPGGETLLIDGGVQRNAGSVRAALEREAGGIALDAVIATQFDADHLAGVVEVLAGADANPGNADDLLPALTLAPFDDGACTTQTCGRMRSLAAWPFEAAAVGRRFALGDVEVEIVAAEGDVGDGPIAGASAVNELSIAVLVRYGGRKLLIAGDITGGGLGTVDLETPLARKTGPVDVLRVAHHGSRTSSAASALDLWQPLAAVFSFGTDNSYCHPAPEVLERVALRAGAVYSTGRGVIDAVDCCDAPTAPPPGARLGLGDLLLVVDETGELTLAGDRL